MKLAKFVDTSTPYINKIINSRNYTDPEVALEANQDLIRELVIIHTDEEITNENAKETIKNWYSDKIKNSPLPNG
ncbi:hypothetical protein ACIQ4I_12405 [Rummeliibacillus sp. NPDC094406]|uniref:hypothetical protein n=1 Tax=Rummeliibacillus sp. NPDC094406 TaxID=3364511 RepID=UPI00381AD145